jgi:DNA replication protein DnaC
MTLEEIIPQRVGDPKCSRCRGVGVFLAEFVRGSQKEAIIPCSCVTEFCQSCPSQGQLPYLVYDEMSDSQIPCECHNARFLLRRMESLMETANIPSRYRFKFLNNIEIDNLQDEEMSFLIAHDWANDLIHRWKDPEFKPQGFYLWGGTGSGKSLLACVILNELIFRYNVKCKYAKVNKDFLNAIRNTYSKDGDNELTERSIEQEFLSADVLVLDDFGVQKDSDFNNMKLYDMIDSRYEAEKITLITSNSPLIDWRDKGLGRIYSRLCEMTKEIQLKCTDYRLKYQSRQL